MADLAARERHPEGAKIVESVSRADVRALEGRATFICGHPKSGTSLVRSLLDSHPQLIVYPEETRFFRQVLPAAIGTTDERRRRLVRESYLSIFKWDAEQSHPSQERFPGRDYSSVSYAYVEERFEEFLGRSPSEPSRLLSSAVLAYGEAAGQIGLKTMRWVEKTPYNERYSDLIYDYWPEAKCLHVVRDPRDNFASYRVKHPDWWPETFAYSWKRSTRKGIRNLERFGSERYLIVRFEDLVRSPETELTRICEFLGVNFASELDRPTRAGESWAGNSMFGDQFPEISAIPVGRWRGELNESEASLLETALARQMVRFSYSRSGAWRPDRWLRWSWYVLKRRVHDLVTGTSNRRKPDPRDSDGHAD